jgi:hypothetical protein
MDAIDGLAALEQVVETIGEQLDDLYQRRDIPQIERVTLHSLEWTLAKLNDDLHTMETEVKDLRLAEASARRGASEAQQKQRDEQLQSLSVFNGLRRDLEKMTEERDSLKREVADLRTKAERKPWMEWQPPANVDKLYKRIPGDAIMVHKLLVGDDLPALYEAGWRYLPITPENELTKKAGELPAEPGAEPYQWQAGDQVVRDGLVREVQYVQHANGLLRICKEGLAQQCDHEQAGWKLYRKASEPLGTKQLTAVQVRLDDWACPLPVAEPISDSTGTDGEGQS